MPWKKSPPLNGYYAVIFSSTKSDNLNGYAEMDELTMKLAMEQTGFLGYEAVVNGNKSIFISYWESLSAIEKWKHDSVHKQAKSQAKKWYKRYLSQICKVEHTHLNESE